jgi:hypothetical protein
VKSVGKNAILILWLSIKSQVPQIEVAVAENNTVLILRHLESFNAEDEGALLKCANQLGISFYPLNTRPQIL